MMSFLIVNYLLNYINPIKDNGAKTELKIHLIVNQYFVYLSLAFKLWNFSTICPLIKQSLYLEIPQKNQYILKKCRE